MRGFEKQTFLMQDGCFAAVIAVASAVVDIMADNTANGDALVRDKRCRGRVRRIVSLNDATILMKFVSISVIGHRCLSLFFICFMILTPYLRLCPLVFLLCLLLLLWLFTTFHDVCVSIFPIGDHSRAHVAHDGVIVVGLVIVAVDVLVVLDFVAITAIHQKRESRIVLSTRFGSERIQTCLMLVLIIIITIVIFPWRCKRPSTSLPPWCLSSVIINYP